MARRAAHLLLLDACGYDCFVFVALAGMDFLAVALRVFGASGAHCRLVPVLAQVVLDVDFGFANIAVDGGIDQRERDLSHAGGLAVTRAREDDVLHVDAAQRAR